MLSCQEVSKLVSESLDRELTIWQRLNLWMHVGMCAVCRRFRRDLVHLNEETRQHVDEMERDLVESDVKLSDEARDRMKRMLES